MKKIVLLVVFYFLLMSTCNSQQGWFVSCSSQPLGTLRDIFFIDSLTGWITQDEGKLIKTTDGGFSWVQYNSGSVYDLNAIKFINALTGWAAGGKVEYAYPFVWNHSVIVKTTNGGINWITQFYTTPGGPPFSSISLVSDTVLFVSGGGQPSTTNNIFGILFKTYNGGTNWICDSLVTGVIQLTSNCFINSQTGWVDGYITNYPPAPYQIYVLKTTNSGVNWFNAYCDSVQANHSLFLKLVFLDFNTGYLNAGLLKKTTNGGYNWNNIDSLNTYSLSDIFFISKDTGWICKNPIKRTNNGGLNWTNQTIPNTTQKLFFINSLTGWAIGNSPRVVLKTTTGGVTFINSLSSNIPDRFELYQNFPNPFNPITKIKFDITSGFPSGAHGNDKVVLKVFDITGKEVATLVNESLKPGTYEVTFDGTQYTSGVYFYRLSTSDFTETKKMLMIK